MANAERPNEPGMDYRRFIAGIGSPLLAVALNQYAAIWSLVIGHIFFAAVALGGYYLLVTSPQLRLLWAWAGSGSRKRMTGTVILTGLVTGLLGSGMAWLLITTSRAAHQGASGTAPPTSLPASPMPTAALPAETTALVSRSDTETTPTPAKPPTPQPSATPPPTAEPLAQPGTAWGLTPNQIALIAQRMEPFGGHNISLSFVAGSDDSARYARHFETALKAAGWKNPSGIGARYYKEAPYGLRIEIRSEADARSLATPCGAFINALNEAGIRPVHAELSPDLTEGEFRIRVGLPPS